MINFHKEPDLRIGNKSLEGIVSPNSGQVWSIQSTGSAFVATLRKGSLVAWGNMHHGGVL